MITKNWSCLVKVGDLVTFSAYGLNRDYNLRLHYNRPYPVGIVVAIRPDLPGVKGYPYKVMWTHIAGSGLCHSRRELKKAVLS